MRRCGIFYMLLSKRIPRTEDLGREAFSTALQETSKIRSFDSAKADDVMVRHRQTSCLFVQSDRYPRLHFQMNG